MEVTTSKIVKIIEDVRDGGNAKGELGCYEGEFPFFCGCSS